MFVLGSNAAGGYNLTDSVRFRDSATAYLERTQVNGTTTTWTYSGWVKRATLSNQDPIFTVGENSTNDVLLYFMQPASDDKIHFQVRDSSVARATLITTARYRDPSAWYHIVAVYDSTNATSGDRIRLYVNGERVTAFDTETYPSLNQTSIANNSSYIQRIGRLRADASYFDGYMTEINFVDGQALTPSDFGETDTDTGVWKPKKYTGTYGTNGFYLPMKPTTQAEGFNTVTYTGTGTDYTEIKNVGFSPDFVWFKQRSGTEPNILFDTIRGADNGLSSNATTAEVTFATSCIRSFDSDGFTVGTNTRTNTSGATYVAWCWEAGGTAVTNTNGTITSSVSANTAKGFSVLTYTGNGVLSTIGHGLSSAPDMIITKRRDAVDGWFTYHSALGKDEYLNLSSTSASGTTLPNYWGTSEPTSTVYGVNTYGGTNTNGGSFVSYCFAEVAGFSKFGSYTGTGSAGNSITGLGFRPAWIMYKRTDTTSNWTIHDITRDPSNEGTKRLYPNLSNAEQTVTGDITFDSDGFTLDGTGGDSNAAGGTYIYMAFADTRDNQWNFDASGNKNNWTPVNINSNASSETTYDIMSDVPTLTDEDTSNFATWNPLSETSSLSTSEANLAVNNTVLETQHRLIRATMGMSTGKYYWEVNVNNSAYVDMVGIINSSYNGTDNQTVNVSNGFGYGYSTTNGNWYVGGGWTSDGVTPSAFPSSGIIGVAFDADNKKLYFSRNNTWINSANPSAGTGANATYTGSETEFLPALSIYYNTGTWRFNFGQRPFAYTPPTGYKKLNTYNLPDSSIVDGSDYFDVDTWSGTTSAQYDTQSRSSLSFSPDLVWIKSRSDAVDHTLVDSVTGTGKYLSSNTTTAQTTDATGYASVYSFDTNGWTMEYNGRTSMTGRTYVGWLWRGSDSAPVSNTAGTITSTVSANTTSGFSIITYTGTGSAGSVGHGLSVAPEIWIGKNRTTAFNWLVHTTIIDGSLDYLWLNLTDAKGDQGAGWDADSTKINLASVSTAINTSGNNHIIYAFHSVEGFSKFSKYTGNGSTDGPFVYTGFRPAFVITKRVEAIDINNLGRWKIHDTTRDTYNPMGKELETETSNAEGASTRYFDFLSNGFKVRDTNTMYNANGYTYIYMAFAENPFKNSLAR